MKARFELKDMNLTLSNVTLPEALDSYVLFKAIDKNNNEITLELTHEQAEFLQKEFKELNERRKEHIYEPSNKYKDETYNLFNIDLSND
jgi:hypothetical protein